MAKTKSSVAASVASAGTSTKLVSARVHCPECGEKFVTDVAIEGAPQKGSKTNTVCRVCKEAEKTSFLIFDRPYKK